MVRLLQSSAALLTLTPSLAFGQPDNAAPLKDGSPTPTQFVDAAAETGLGAITAARVCSADLNGDGRPDVIIRALTAGGPDRFRIFINTPTTTGNADAVGKPPLTFREVLDHGLPTPIGGDCLVFADMNNDGRADAILTRSLDINNANFKLPAAPDRTAILRGKGDGTFEPATLIESATRATTACIAVGDQNKDGRLDLFLGNWYTAYGTTNEAFPNDLLLQEPSGGFRRVQFPNESDAFSEETDLAGRPTYGALFTSLGILELNYGRRANRLWVPSPESGASFIDIAPMAGLDGDADRSGKYPEWLKERGKVDPRFDRADEKPYRSHGNTFDGAIGDIDSDGDFDIVLAEITHGWAGPSSDRSRVLMNNGAGVFAPSPLVSLDRFPSPDPDNPATRNWNQGDLFCELADFDLDGRLDLLLSSGDYPDNQRLRLYRQLRDGSFELTNATNGLDHEGSQQISLADFDGDGDLDILVGQSFNRLSAAQIAGRTPTVRLYMNQTRSPSASLQIEPSLVIGTAASISITLWGNPERGVPLDALGTIVRITADLDGDPSTPAVTQSRQLIGIGGHAGKQHQFLIHAGLGRATKAERIDVIWPSTSPMSTTLYALPAGAHTITLPGIRPPKPDKQPSK